MSLNSQLEAIKKLKEQQQRIVNIKLVLLKYNGFKRCRRHEKEA